MLKTYHRRNRVAYIVSFLMSNSVLTLNFTRPQKIFFAYWDEVVKMSNDEEQWRVVIKKFASRWNFPNTIGAIGGKHIALKAPHNSGTVYDNNKGIFSIIILALVDGDYKFL